MFQNQSTSTKDELFGRLVPLLQEVKDMTTSNEVEQRLNNKYGVESALYQDLARLITLGVQAGWAADAEIAGPRYRRSRLALPSEATCFFSVTAVLMDSTDNTQGNPEGSFRGDLPRALLNQIVESAGPCFRFTRACFFCNLLHWWWISVWLVVTLDKQHSQLNRHRLQIPASPEHHFRP